MGNYGFINNMSGNQGIFAVLIYLVIFLPIIIGLIRHSKYLKFISITMAITFVLNILTLPQLFGFKLFYMIGLDGMALISGIFFVLWLVCLVLSFFKKKNK